MMSKYKVWSTRYRELIEKEENSKWGQGDVLLEATGKLFPDQLRSQERSTFFNEFAGEVGQHSTTVRLRYRTSRVFPADRRAQDRSWWFHCICAKAEDRHHPGRAEQWLDLAIANGWGQTELEAHIKAADKDPSRVKDELDPDDPRTPSTVTKAAQATVVSCGRGQVTLQFTKDLPLGEGEVVVVTMVKYSPPDDMDGPLPVEGQSVHSDQAIVTFPVPA